MQEFIPEEDKERVREVLAGALAGRETADFEMPMRTRAGQRVEVLLNAASRRDESGTIIGAIGVGQDITERKRVEGEKARAAQELQTFIDMANAPIFGTDAAGRIVEWNNKAAELTGVSKAEALGLDLVNDFIAPDARVAALENRAQVMSGSAAADLECPFLARDGHRVELLVNAAVRLDADGAAVGIIGVGRDVTDMRRLMRQEAELLRLQAANEAKSQARFESALNYFSVPCAIDRQFFIYGVRCVRQFLATMSHEMRTPLNVILGMNALVMDSPLSDEQREFSQQIRAASESLLFLINDILDLAKVECQEKKCQEKK